MIELRQPEIETVNAERTAYDRIYADRGIYQRDSLYLWLLNLLQPSQGETLLDVSCGEGALVRFAARRGVHATGVDLSVMALRTARKRTENAQYAAADAEHLIFADGAFDYVTNIGSLEHYLDPAQGVREMRRVIKPSGTVCVLLPNTYSLFGNIKHNVLTGNVYQGEQPIERYNTLVGWETLLSQNGLDSFRIVKYEMPVPQTIDDWFWYALRPPKSVHLLLSTFLPLSLANCFVYFCRPNRSTT